MNKKRKLKKKVLLILILLLVLLAIIKIIPITYFQVIKKDFDESSSKIYVSENKNPLAYNIFDMINSFNNDLIIEFSDKNGCVYEQNLVIKLSNLNIDKQHIINYKVNGEEFNENIEAGNSEYTFSVKLEEGKNEISFENNEDENLNKITKDIYFIKPYEKQFLDEIEENGVQVHYKLEDLENYELDIELLKTLGVNYVRAGFTWELIEKNNGNYDFSYYDTWMNVLKENKIKVIANLGTNSTKYIGADKKFSSEEEIDHFVEFVNQILKHYPYIEDFEILNEPNYNSNGYLYKAEEEIKWYVDMATKVKNLIQNNNENATVNFGSLSIDRVETENNITPIDFLNIAGYASYKEFNAISIHPYDWFNYSVLNQTLILNIEPVLDKINDMGGFLTVNSTEFGATSFDEINLNEDVQANKLIQQSTLMDRYNMNQKIIYNFWNMGTDINEREDNFGLITNDYKPKKAYYAVKKFYEYTNGAEYIGTMENAENLEIHVYDKNGKPKIIIWTNQNNRTFQIPYENFTASDIYGNVIENTDGTLEITTSPIYLDNMSDTYFYEAISNTALEKYEEFEEKFEAEIANINGLQEAINTLKQYMASIASNSTEDENVAIEQMNTHFNLGNVILSAYKNGNLNVEYVKLSSMLDMLNDIGNSYEDLLTVCATTRAPYYQATDELINSAESKINNNSDLEIVYPSKILDFAKELDEKSEYINSLSEENDIKTGLIVSNSLHAYYLADWANEFASIYIDEYIEANPVTISYTNSTDWTNNDVVATLNIGNDATVTNNGGSNTYTFRSNGSFTFEYERRGQAFTLEARVSNIDKTYPTITGVEDGQTYTSSVKPVIEDTNLFIVSISYNGEDIGYYDGITLEDDGMYSIVATDRAGNTTTVEFNIISAIQDEYIIQNNYLLNVWQETTLTDFKNNFTSHEESYVIKRNDTELTDTDIIATGDTIELSSGDTYTIVVAGDINCDGRVTVFDFSALRRYILKQIEFTEIELLAADINLDYNDVGVMDYSRMRIEILNR